METLELIKEKVAELTDVDAATIQRDTPLSALDLVSLDYVAIQIALRKQKNINLDLNNISRSGIVTVGDLVSHVENQP